MSDTPRTDSQLLTVKDCSYVAPHPTGEYVRADFARQLERENAALRKTLADADVLYQYGRDDGRREWAVVETWIGRGDIIVQIDRAAFDAARAEEGQSWGIDEIIRQHLREGGTPT